MVGARKRTRIRLIIIGAVALVAAAALAGMAFRDSIVFFFGPSELMEKAATGEVGPDRRLRLGGLVEAGSVENVDDGVVVFSVSDGATAVPVRFDGVLPDLFREGQGIVAEGRYRDGEFVAETVLAKHDENYMPPEVAKALKEQGTFREQ
jgi:cytochrome c-type biogenesis protein CcmE